MSNDPWGAATPRRAGHAAVALALVVLVATGCSGDEDGGGGTSSNGLEDRSAAQVMREAAAALEAAQAVHVSGTGIADGSPVEVDLRFDGEASTGTITSQDTRLQITRVGDETYVKGDEAALLALGVQPEMHAAAAGRWLKLAPEQSSGVTGFSIDSFAEELTTNESPVEAEVEQTELDGRPVVVVRRADGSRLYVANTGPAHPLRAESEAADEDRIDFSDYGTDFRITAPTVFVEVGELVWLDAITKLRAGIDEPFTTEINMTQAMMVTLGAALGRCSPELARIGSPGERLQPVHDLVAQACTRYDEGARCFETAAGVSDRSGAVVVGTPAQQIQSDALDCGFAAQGDAGNLLTQAEAQGRKITGAPPADRLAGGHDWDLPAALTPWQTWPWLPARGITGGARRVSRRERAGLGDGMADGHDHDRGTAAPPDGRTSGPAEWARSSAVLAVGGSIALALVAALVTASIGDRARTSEPAPSTLAAGRSGLAESVPRSLPAAEVAGIVAVELGFDRVQVDCQGDLVIAKGASVACLAPDGDGVWLQVDVRVADAVDGQPVLEFFDETGLHVAVLGNPLTDAERDWLLALRDLQGMQRELLYPDAAGIDAQTLREWSADAARCTAELGPGGPPSARLAEAGRRAVRACDELDLAATAFEAAAVRADSTDEHDIRVRAERVRTAVARWEWGNYLLEEAWRVARQTAPGVGAG